MPLATTPAGKTFAIKTLHPADHEIKSIRSPGGMVPSVGITADMLATIDFPEGSTYARLIQTPSPVCPLTVMFYNDADTLLEYWPVFNTAIGGPGFTKLEGNATWPRGSLVFLADAGSKFEKYKVLAQSVTTDLVAPALADQGTVVGAQYVESKRTTNPSQLIYNENMEWSGTAMNCDFWYYSERPPISSLLMGTSAYSNKAREGAYQPLKIDSHKWRAVADPYLPIDMYDPSKPQAAGQTAQGADGFRLGNYPMHTGNCPWTRGSAGLLKPQTDIVGIIEYRGVATAGVSLRIRLRQCLEVIPRIGGIYAPLAEAPFPPDTHSELMIKEIFGKMRDAYPASYNSTGQLRDIIHKIGAAVSKYVDPALSLLSAVPGLGSIVAPVRSAMTLGRAIGNALPASAKKGSSSPKKNGGSAKKKPQKTQKQKGKSKRV